MYDWLNLGLQHPDTTGLNDPLLGANEERTSRFDIAGVDRSFQLCGFGRFVEHPRFGVHVRPEHRRVALPRGALRARVGS